MRNILSNEWKSTGYMKVVSPLPHHHSQVFHNMYSVTQCQKYTLSNSSRYVGLRTQATYEYFFILTGRLFSLFLEAEEGREGGREKH